MSSGTVAECHGCGKQKRLVHITADDIQRTRQPFITMVCEECREKYRSAARLETSYSTGSAVKDLALMVLIGFSLLLLWSNLISYLHVSFILGTTGISLLLPAVVFFSGVKQTYSVARERYGFTHDLAWTLHSRYAIMGIALVLSSILAMIFHAFLY